MTHLFTFLVLSLLTVACSEQGFTGGSGGGEKKAEDPAMVSPNNANASGNGIDPGPNNGTNVPVSSGAPFELSVANGGSVLNVPLGKIEITMTVDHVTDFVITDNELYAIHHELALPKFGAIVLYDKDGKVIDTQNWAPTWGNCPVHPTSDANCPSSKLTLKAGIAMNKIATKKKGRGGFKKTCDAPFTVRILDCGSDCSSYGGSGKGLSSTDTYVWTME